MRKGEDEEERDKEKRRRGGRKEEEGVNYNVLVVSFSASRIRKSSGLKKCHLKRERFLLLFESVHALRILHPMKYLTTTQRFLTFI